MLSREDLQKSLPEFTLRIDSGLIVFEWDEKRTWMAMDVEQAIEFNLGLKKAIGILKNELPKAH